ncbi:MAG: response regulator, partial [Desulfobacterales bacterium]|nr:response regulator [Desulfobacterales bacterium]
RFEIKDSGVGIAEDQMDTVFQPFEQAAEVRFKSAGAGLGLPISRKLVRLMGGEPRVESVPGKGSTFQFQLRLPVLHGPAAPPREPNEAIVGYSGPARGILVVDDKTENRLALAGMLSPLGFDVIQAGGGREGVELAASASIDLVIMDLIMPDLDGMAATRRIRALDGRGNLPVIAYSASAFAEDRERCLAAGCNEFLPKPASREELLGILRKYLALEWQNASPPEPLESPAEMEEPPPAADLEELHELARYGNMRKIRQWSETLPTRSPGARAFAEHIRTLAENYEERKIITLLEKLKEKES